MKVAAMKLAAVATGGALGASLRYVAASLTHALMGENFPYGTLMVNILGSLIIGYLLILMPETEEQVPIMRLLLITGLLGGFTTYSAFSIETLQLIQDGHLTRAGMNVMFTLLFCFLAVWAGYLLGKGIHVRA